MLGVAGCAAGPQYEKPAIDMPVAWKPEESWSESHPRDGDIKGQWWEIFDDPKLNALEQQLLIQNLSLRAAEAHLMQARAQVTIATSSLFPSLKLGAGASRLKSSANRPLANYSTPNVSTVQNDFNLNFNVQYEADVFGRVHDVLQGVQASAEQAKADFENMRLLMTAELATDYLTIRELDAEISVVDQGIELQKHALKFVVSRHDSGAASGLDVARQQTQLEENLAQQELLRKQRHEFEHALATLMGIPAPRFTLELSHHLPLIPVIPVGVPSNVLERRPDIASAERAVAVANAQVGIAKTAFFPTILLSPTVGWDSNRLAALFDAPSVLWSLGTSVTQTIFDWGKNQANVDSARLGYEATVATYKQTVLIAMQEVENGITGLSTLARAHHDTEAAIKSAQHLLNLVNARYEGGIATDLERITAQQELLSNQRQAVQLYGQQTVMSVYLVKALGGGWQTQANK